jgi:hypothetical protein
MKILIEELKDLKDVDITPEKMRQIFTSTFAKADEGMKGQINMAGTHSTFKQNKRYTCHFLNEISCLCSSLDSRSKERVLLLLWSESFI